MAALTATRGFRRQVTLPAAGDPAGAVALREALAAQRAAGVEFDGAWPAATADALADVAPHERELWECAFDDTRSAWQAGYERAAVPGGGLFVVAA